MFPSAWRNTRCCFNAHFCLQLYRCQVTLTTWGWKKKRPTWLRKCPVCVPVWLQNQKLCRPDQRQTNTEHSFMVRVRSNGPTVAWPTLREPLPDTRCTSTSALCGECARAIYVCVQPGHSSQGFNVSPPVWKLFRSERSSTRTSKDGTEWSNERLVMTAAAEE